MPFERAETVPSFECFRRSFCTRTDEPFVLVIDDDPQILHVTQFILKRHGFQTIVATTPEEGLHLAAELRPNLVICDAALPRISGPAVLRILKSTPETSAIPVILMSGHEGLDCEGIYTFLRKPFDTASLVGASRNAIAGHSD